MPTRRRYQSPVRDAQRAATTERILTTALGLLAEQGLDQVTIPAVAASAGLSPATVYRHFPTVDALLAGFLEWVRPRIGMGSERLLGAAPAGLPELAEANFALFEEHSALLLPLMESREFNRQRLGSRSGRSEQALRAMGAAAGGVAERDAAGAVGVVYLLTSPQAWRWLRETWDLDAAAAARAVRWAAGVLVAALANEEEAP